MLLDTCALLWLAQGGGQLSPEALQQLAEAPFVYVSAISGFEIGIKHAKGKLELPMLPLPWFTRLLLITISRSFHWMRISVFVRPSCPPSTMIRATA